MIPPEILHVMDAGLIMYMMESLQEQNSGGKSCDELNEQHICILHVIRHWSERDFPCGAVQNHLMKALIVNHLNRRVTCFQ
jgi:hypothetical protein